MAPPDPRQTEYTKETRNLLPKTIIRKQFPDHRQFSHELT